MRLTSLHHLHTLLSSLCTCLCVWQFSGPLPSWLSSMTTLQHLNLANTLISGQVRASSLATATPHPEAPPRLAQLRALTSPFLSSFALCVWCAGAGGGAGRGHPLDVSRRTSPSLLSPSSPSLATLSPLSLPPLPLLSPLVCPVSLTTLSPPPLSPCSLPPPQLSNMYLTGPLPPTVTALTQLQALRMGNNFLAGQLPPLLGAYNNAAQPPAPLAPPHPRVHMSLYPPSMRGQRECVCYPFSFIVT